VKLAGLGNSNRILLIYNPLSESLDHALFNFERNRDSDKQSGHFFLSGINLFIVVKRGFISYWQLVGIYMAQKVEEFLSQKQLEVGDHIRVKWKGISMDGIVLPPTPGHHNALHLKLTSGYNTGILLEHISDISKTQLPVKRKREVQTVKTEVPDTQQKPRLSLITTGGTIVAKVDYETAGTSSKMTPEELLSSIPEIGKYASIGNVITPFTKLSGEMDSDDWISLANVCFEELQKPEIKGVILTQGTDTLHFTSSALSFMIRNLSKPLIVVGAQRSSDRGSSDSPFNLLCASHLALSEAAEVGVCMHGTTSDDYCLFLRGTKVRKMHTSRRDTFRPVNTIPIAKVTPGGKIDFLSKYNKRSNREMRLDAVFEKNVALIKIFPGMSGKIFDFYDQNGCKGYILEGTGLGHTNPNIHSFIKKITDKGIPVFMTSQTVYGRINLNVYSYGRQLKDINVTGLEDMLSETAYVKLGWILAHTQDAEEVKKMMLTPLSGEIEENTRVDSFLY
jgi:glutamyl-tRNA(Gln) amidotransferase subunit D